MIPRDPIVETLLAVDGDHEEDPLEIAHQLAHEYMQHLLTVQKIVSPSYGRCGCDNCRTMREMTVELATVDKAQDLCIALAQAGENISRTIETAIQTAMKAMGVNVTKIPNVRTDDEGGIYAWPEKIAGSRLSKPDEPTAN